MTTERARETAAADSEAFEHHVEPPARHHGWDGTAVSIAPPVERDAVVRRALAVADVLAAAATIATTGAVNSAGVDWRALVVAPLIVPLAKALGRYDRDELVLRKSTLDEFPALLGLDGAFAVVWAVLVSALGDTQATRGLHVVLVMTLLAAFLVGTRALVRAMVRVYARPERVLIVGMSRTREHLAFSLCSDPGARVEVVGYLPLHDERRRNVGCESERRVRSRGLDDLSVMVKQLNVERVLAALPNNDSETMLDIVNRAVGIGVKVSIVPSLLEVVGSAIEFDNIGGVTLLGLRRPGLTRSSRAIKRAFDVVGAGAALIIFSPVLVVAAVAIKLDSSGPVFFRQTRIGRRGETFSIVKFRSMRDGAETERAKLESVNETDGVFKLTVDPRVTRVGKVLRKTSMDELPQLINVVRGEMSLVGPRPLIPSEDRLIEGHHRSRLTLAPGMTGPWQVLGPLRPPLSEMAKTDYLYAANWSLWTDIKLLIRTFVHVGSRNGL